ncbi:N-acetyltransferase [Cryobacterium frigoriphilum]|uniref:N-acetyltransferase n=1 Tax=Cryobacterium frigoriphilum TaxID=1259150 RepID=A0A4R9A4V2_9MICO|nr:GNAT family N-acetyltransferase [Cryobacterium frigoriphilum]TFD52236.1 N-acetyltransferase [Cryobacterium frigoriphilum]
MPAFRPFSQHLDTPRLRMRPWQLSDSASVRGLWAERDPRARHVIDADGRPTVDDMRVRIQEQLDESTRTGLALLAIERKMEGDFIGYCGLIVGEATVAEPEIAYELYRFAHGHGYATEAARAVLDAARDTGRTRFWATVRAWNAPSFRVLEKIGFTPNDRVDADAARGDSVWMTAGGHPLAEGR